MTTVSIYGPVADDLSRVDAALASVKQVEYEPLARMLAHVLGGEGKRLRPALALLAGKFGDYDLTSLVPLAASIELLHSATLVHDDVIDEAPLRRGRETSNGLFGNAASVMLGDFMFAHAADFIASTGSVRLVRLFSKTIMSIATGELQQDISAFDYGKGIRDYFGRIAGKTASLFGTACEGGAIASACPEPWIDALREYGFNLGMAFQIVDDILDYTGNQAIMGKPVGSDLLSGTLTLPALLLIERTEGENPVRRLFLARRNRQQRLAEVLEAVHSSGALRDAEAVARDFMNRGLEAIAPLSNGEAKTALIDLSEYVLTRTS
ncbi:MAG TPA: polyprenyl synthetase family protein [Dehalococcoidia bacterium]